MISLLNYIVWDVRPEVFSFLHLPRWYGLMWGMGVLLSYKVMQFVYLKESKNEKQFSGLVMFILLGCIIGARLGHILFYDPIYYWHRPWEVLPFKLDNGFELTGIEGLASHGGALGVLLSIAFYSKKFGLRYLWVADRLVIVGALCGAFIRVGNLFNSEIYGLPTNVSWAFIFTNVDRYPRHPTQLYEAVVYFILFAILFFSYHKGYFKYSNGMILGLFFIVLFTFRFFVEFLKVDQESINYGISINAGQLLSIPLILVGFVLVFFQKHISKTNL